MGGAPFNVAWHLAGLGANPLFISRIGQDPRGAAVLAGMHDWAMDCTGIQTDTVAPTGQVRITLQGSSHSFDILPDQAYDHIALQEALAATNTMTPALVYCGSLITRTPIARATLAGLRSATSAPVFVDINLRSPWWEPSQVETLMHSASWLKINDDELRTVRSDAPTSTALETLATQLRNELGVEWLILTQGATGAVYIGDEVHRGSPPVIENLVDTIGAGDAFSAVTILGLLKGWPMSLTLARALDFAARICTQRGATQPDHKLYAGLRQEWKL